MTIFESIDKENNKRIEEIKVKINKAENEKSKLQEKLNINSELEEYSNTYLKIKSYEDFIRNSREQIILIKSNPYKKEDLIKEKEIIQKEYNPKLKKIYSDIISQINKLDDSFEKYKEITQEFLIRRDTLNRNANQINEVCNVYEGEGIKNDYYIKYDQVVSQLREISRDNKVE